MTATLEGADPPAAAEPQVPPRRRRPGDLVTGAVVAVCFQGVLTVFGAVVERAFSPLQSLTGGRAPASPSLLQHMDRWDAGFFHWIPDGYYQLDPQSPAFYPLFPILARGVELAGFGLFGFLAAGLILNTIATWVVVVTLLRITQYFIGERGFVGERATSWLAVAIMLTAPTAFFLHEFYSEATFMALGFTAYLLALRRRWMLMGLCLVPLTATRITAVLFVGLCFLEFWRAGGWRWRALLSPAVLWFPVSVLGFGCYALYLHLANGDALAMFHAYEAGPFWSFHVFDPNISATLAEQAGVVGRAVFGDAAFSNYTLADQVLPLTGLVLLLAASGYLAVVLRGDGVPLAVFGLMSFVMFTLNSNLVSVHRYLLPCLVLYIASAVLVSRHPRVKPAVFAVMYAGVLLQGALMALFTSNAWAG